MSIITLLKANIRYRKGSFISVLILSFMISLCLTTILSINHNIEERADKALEQVETGDLVPIVWDVNCPDTMLKDIEEYSKVDHIRVVKTITQMLTINGIQLNSSTFFLSYDSEKLSYQIFDQGKRSFQSKPAELESGEIYVPISFERLYGCKEGDTAYLTVGDQRKSFVIKGFFEEPFLGCEAMGIKLALMNETDYSELYAQRLLTKDARDENPDGIRCYYFVNIFEAKDSSLLMSDFRKAINKETGILDYSLFTQSKEQSKSVTLMFAQIVSGIMLVFLVLLFAVVLIVIGHSISTGIRLDYTNLGVLKAIGFDKGRLRRVFVLEYILAELAGTLFGVAGSIPATYYLNIVFVKMTGLLIRAVPAFGSCLPILAAIMVVSALFIYIKTSAIAKISPVRAILGGRDSVHFRSRMEVAVEGRGLYIRLAFRQLTSNLRQYAGSAVIVAILVYFLVTITLLGTSFNRQTIEESFGAVSSDVGVYYNPQGNKTQEEIGKLRGQVEADISSISEITQAFKISGGYFTVDGDEYHVSIYEDPSIIKSILKGRAPIYDNEIALTEIVAEELGKHIGDTVTVGEVDSEAEYMITGYIQSTTDMGRETVMSYEGAKRLMPDYYMNYVDYQLKDSKKSAEVVESLSKKYGKQIEAEDVNANSDFGEVIISSMVILNYIIYAISVLFTLIVILIVCGRIYLKERMDFGIYKALGFTDTLLRLQFALRFAMVALAGGVFGILLNLCFNNRMMSVMLKNVGITSFVSTYNIISILLPVVVLTVCFFAFAYLASGKIKRVDIKSLICNN